MSQFFDADRLAMAIPAEIREKQLWLTWKRGPTKPSGRFDKVPYYASGIKRNGTQGSEQDRAQLVTFDQALKAVQRFVADGIGLAILPGCGIAAGDFDECVSGDRNIPDHIRRMIEGTYAEISVSGTGVRTLWSGNCSSWKDPDRHIEVFGDTGFITLSGNLIQLEGLAPLPGWARHRPERTSETLKDGDDHFVSPKTIRDLRSALFSMRADDYAQWVRMGLALRELGDQGRELWLTWSATSEKFDPIEASKKWDTFRPDATGYAAVFADAQRHGWTNPSSSRGSAESSSDHSVYGSNDWPEPMSLDVPNLPPWPRDVLPDAFGEFADRLTQSTETPPELAAMLVFACLGIAAQGKYRVRVKADYSEPTNIWTATFLPPGSRKSRVLDECMVPIKTWERKKAEEMAGAIREAEIQCTAIEERIKALHKCATKLKGSELKECLAEIAALEAEKPPVPKVPQLWGDDVTPENLGTIMANNAEHMGIMSAEGGIFDTIGGRYSKGVPNLDIFLQSHAGDSVRVNRGSRPPVFMERPVLTMGLAPQPDVLRSLAATPSFRGRGLLGRFLYAVPLHNLGTRTLDTLPMPGDVLSNYSGALLAILDHPWATDARERPCAHMLALEPRAFECWAEMWYATEFAMRDGGELEHVRDWAGKFPGTIARLAGLVHVALHAMRSPAEFPVSEATMADVLRLADPLKAHALAAFEVLNAKPEVDDARKVLGWIRQTEQSVFSFRDCHRAHQSRFPVADDLVPAIRVLEERGWVREVIRDGPHGRGRKPSKLFEVNPRLKMGQPAKP